MAEAYVKDKHAREELGNALSRLLADSYTLYLENRRFVLGAGAYAGEKPRERRAT